MNIAKYWTVKKRLFQRSYGWRNGVFWQWLSKMDLEIGTYTFLFLSIYDDRFHISRLFYISGTLVSACLMRPSDAYMRR